MDELAQKEKTVSNSPHVLSSSSYKNIGSFDHMFQNKAVSQQSSRGNSSSSSTSTTSVHNSKSHSSSGSKSQKSKSSSSGGGSTRSPKQIANSSLHMNHVGGTVLKGSSSFSTPSTHMHATTVSIDSKAKLKETLNNRNLLRLNFEQANNLGDSTVLLSSSSPASSAASVTTCSNQSTSSDYKARQPNLFN